MSAGAAAVQVTVVSRDGLRPLPRPEVIRILSEAGSLVGAPPGEVSVLFTGDREMRGLNRRFRGRNRPTDVLSFPDGNPLDEEIPRIGDIAISVPTARKNAVKAGHPLTREVRCLLIHGFLHLLGYDHEVDGGEMKHLEGELRASLLPRRAGGR